MDEFWPADADEVFFPDCYDDALSTTPTMKDRCVQCPGRAGTSASENQVTMHTLAKCIERRFPFMCHMTREGEFCTHLCAHWVSRATVKVIEVEP
jgi:hypothetical protein